MFALHRIALTKTTDLLNGTYACENDKVMNDIIKREMGFQGCKSFFLPFGLLKC